MNNPISNTSTIDKSIPQPVDAIIEVSISNDKLEATVKIEPPKHGGIGPNIQTLRTAFANKNVTYGINNKILLDICNKPTYNKDIIFARGTEPINGIDGTYEILFQVLKDSKPKERDDGTVDFHNLEIVENVKQGQVLCRITHPTEGKDGISVTREKISSIKGKPVPSLLGKNTRLNKDGNAIVATIDGQVECNNGKINVNETLYIKDNVDNSTGNIKVVGNVIINGAVLPGFIVEAAGNIQVNGGVSSATLIAGGNIILASGVIGGKLNCGGDLTSRFIENSSVFVKGNIKTDYIMNSNIKCGKSLQTVSSISRIVGGVYVVGQNVVARIIGSSAGINTSLELGTDSAIIERQQELIKELPSLEAKIHSLKNLISLLRQFESSKRLTPDKKQMLENALFSYEEITELFKNGKEELEQITESIRVKGYGRIICTDTIHPGTTVKIGSVQMRIREPLLGKSLYYSEEGICIGIAK